MKIDDRTVLITGGAGGIGFALAKQFLARGGRVIALDVNADALKEAAEREPRLRAVPCDVTDADAVERLRADVEREFGVLDVLFNNAAISLNYSFLADDAALANMEREIATNLAAPLRLIRVFLPLLMTSDEPAVVNVTSDLAHIPIHHKPLYTSTKAALHAVTVALRDDPARGKLKIFEAQPPPVGVKRTETRDYYIGLGPQMKPDDYAAALVRGLAADRYEIRFRQSLFTYYMSRLFPRTIRRIMSKKRPVKRR
jgi:uncharacterized oxidoreductase